MNKSGGNAQVLIIDEDNFLLGVYSARFRENDFAVRIARTGKEAIKVLSEEYTPDIIILDMILPDMDGMEVLKKIKKEKLAGDATLVVLSNERLPEKIEEAKELGVDGYIVKPSIMPSEVFDEVCDIYERRKKS